MSVDQDLARIVATTFAQTERLLENGDVTLVVATQGVEKIMSDLAERYPRHADWIQSRLAAWRRTHAH